MRRSLGLASAVAKRRPRTASAGFDSESGTRRRGRVAARDSPQAGLDVPGHPLNAKLAGVPVAAIGGQRRAQVNPARATAGGPNECPAGRSRQRRSTDTRPELVEPAREPARRDGRHADRLAADPQTPQSLALPRRIDVNGEENARHAAAQSAQPALHGRGYPSHVVQQEDRRIGVGGPPQPGSRRATRQPRSRGIGTGSLQRARDVIEAGRTRADRASARTELGHDGPKQGGLAHAARTPEQQVFAARKPQREPSRQPARALRRLQRRVLGWHPAERARHLSHAQRGRHDVRSPRLATSEVPSCHAALPGPSPFRSVGGVARRTAHGTERWCGLVCAGRHGARGDGGTRPLAPRAYHRRSQARPVTDVTRRA